MRVFVPLLVIFTVLGWGAYWLFQEFGIFASVPRIRLYVMAVGITLTVLAVVIVAGRFVLNLVMAEMFSIDVTGLTRVVTYMAISFVAVAVTLHLLGFDLRALLTTSAVLGAGIALAMRGSLESIVSGLALSSESILQKGSGLVIDGRMMTVEALKWRHIVARCIDNSFVLVPNTALADQSITIYPANAPVLFGVTVTLPADVPPQQVTNCLAGAFADMEHLDPGQPVKVAPKTLKSTASATIDYELRCYARYFLHTDTLKGEVLRRAWYVLSRAGMFGAGMTPEALTAAVRQASPSMPDDMLRNICAKGATYRFAPTEALVFPGTEDGHKMLILEGYAAIDPGVSLTIVEQGADAAGHLPALVVDRLSKTALLRKIADRLAQKVGPMAERLTRQAIRDARDGDEMIEGLAQHFPQGAERDAFLEDLDSLISVAGRRGPGTIAPFHKDAVGRILPDLELRAETEVFVVTFPPLARSVRVAQ